MKPSLEVYLIMFILIFIISSLFHLMKIMKLTPLSNNAYILVILYIIWSILSNIHGFIKQNAKMMSFMQLIYSLLGTHVFITSLVGHNTTAILVKILNKKFYSPTWWQNKGKDFPKHCTKNHILRQKKLMI